MPKQDYDAFFESFSYETTVHLSAESLALLFFLLGNFNKRFYWHDGDSQLTDSQWDIIEELYSETFGSLQDSSMIGTIHPTLQDTSNLPDNLQECAGQVLDRSDYPILYDKVDPTWRLGTTQIQIPDIRSRFVMSKGISDTLGATGGESEHTLTVGEIPPHDHSWSQYTFGIDIESVGVPDPTGVGQPQLPQSTGITGGGQPHNNLPPFVILSYVIVVR